VVRFDVSFWGRSRHLFPGSRVDNFGYVYATWSDNTDVYYSFSNNHGTRWSPAIKVTQNTSQAGKSNVFPWISADANATWHRVVRRRSSRELEHSPGDQHTLECVRCRERQRPCDLAGFRGEPSHRPLPTTRGRSQPAACWAAPTAASRFFQIGIDPNHLINIAYADNHAGPSVTYFTRQKTAAAGIATRASVQATSHEAGGNGHVNGKHGGQASSVSITTIPTNQLEARPSADSGSGVNFQATQVTAATFDQVAHTVTLTGTGTDNGHPVAFTIIAADSSLALQDCLASRSTMGTTTVATCLMEALLSTKGNPDSTARPTYPVSQFFLIAPLLPPEYSDVNIDRDSAARCGIGG